MDSWAPSPAHIFADQAQVRSEDVGDVSRISGEDAAAVEAASQACAMPRCGGSLSIAGFAPSGELVVVAGPHQRVYAFPLAPSLALEGAPTKAAASGAARETHFRTLLATARAALEALLAPGTEAVDTEAGGVLHGVLRSAESWVAARSADAVAPLALDLGRGGLVAVALHLAALPTSLHIALCVQYGVLPGAMAGSAASAAAIVAAAPSLVRPLIVLLGRLAASAHRPDGDAGAGASAPPLRWSDQRLHAALSRAVRGKQYGGAEERPLAERAASALDCLALALDRVGLHDDALLAATLRLGSASAAPLRAVLTRQKRGAERCAFDIAGGANEASAKEEWSRRPQ